MKFDRVLTVNVYYDGPRLGVAELNGTPHIYEAEFDHSDDEYGDTYFLSPIEADLLKLVMEDWKIWCRWEKAHSKGNVTLESHPALPVERSRHEELKMLIGDRLKTDIKNRIYCQAEFHSAENVPEDSSGLLVEWKMQ